MKRGHSWSTHRKPDEVGAAVVEFTIVLPVVMLGVFAIVALSTMYNSRQALHTAAHDGARVASSPHTTRGDVVNRVRSALTGSLSDRAIQNATITVTPGGNQPCANQPPGTRVVVTVAAPDELSVPIFENASFTVTGRGEFPCK